MAIKFIKLTRANVRKLQLGETVTEHGIQFERLNNNDGKFSINIMVDGERIHRIVGRESDNTTRNQAEELIAKFRTDAKAGRLSLPKGRKMVLGFKEASEKYIARLKLEGGSDIKMKTTRLNHNLIPFFKDKPFNSFKSFDFERFKKSRLDGDLHPPVEKSTVNRDLAVVSHMFAKGIEWGWLSHSPCKIKKYKEGRGRIVYLTPEQIDRLERCAREHQSLAIFLFIKIGLDTSMRRMEILSIKISNIDLERQRIFIPNAKAGKRNQPMTKSLAVYLREYLSNNMERSQVWLFPSPRSKTGHTVSIEKRFIEVVKSAGLDPGEITRHTLRHTAITHLVQAGVDLPTVQSVSGHKSLDMVAKYAHANGAHIDKAMDKLENKIRPPDAAKL